jgi:hypothetical protein
MNRIFRTKPKEHYYYMAQTTEGLEHCDNRSCHFRFNPCCSSYYCARIHYFAPLDSTKTKICIYIYILLLLTAIGLLPGGCSPTLVQTKIKIHKTTITTTKNYKTKKT